MNPVDRDARLGPPPVEPLSDIAWARVERDLWTAIDRGEAAPAPRAERPVTPVRRSVGRYVVAAALVAAAAALLFFVWPRDKARHHDLPSRVATEAAPTTVSFGDAEITVAPQSTMRLAGSPAHGVDIVLERGSARFAVSPRLGRPPFVVHAGAVDVRVVGTVFTVARSGDAARVEVISGEVEVVGHGRRERVLEGETWDSGSDREAATGSSTAITNPGDVAAARTFPEEAPVTEPVKPTPAPPKPVLDLKQMYADAAALEPVDADAALAAYRAIARHDGPWAANALYAAARLAETRDPALALRLAQQYQRRFPRGNNAADAAALAGKLQGASHAPSP
jgi:hypothetical protein